MLSRGVQQAVCPADWADLGRKADPFPGQRMLNEGQLDLAVALLGGRGTGDMIARAEGAGARVGRPLG